jgi:hypothetical protein
MSLKNYLFIICACLITAAAVSTAARETYEDYRDKDQRKGYIKRDKPLSEEKTGRGDEFRDELRGAVRDEIDQSMSRERKASEKKVDKNDIITDVRQIVREEIEDAIKLKQKYYLTKGTIETGGFLSVQFKGLEGDSNDNNFIVKVFPLFNYFVGNTIAASLKGEAVFNLTTNSQAYNVGIGPMFVYGLTKSDDICFYAAIYLGVSMNSSLTNGFGYRYSNELGLKFVMTSGVILNFGTMIAFDDSGDQMTGFQNIIIPTVGITAWF